MKRLLVACEFSGIIRDAFAARGWDAWSCDLLPCDNPKHICGDVMQMLDNEWDMMIAHPPCTYLCSSGMHWTARGLRDPNETKKAIKFAEELWGAPIPKICIENPVGCLSTRSILERNYQAIQPWQFGDDASKKTCLWLKNLPPLRSTKIVAPRIVDGKKRWSNQCDSGQNKLGPSDDRWAKRSSTYLGVADAMAEQWGAL